MKPFKIALLMTSFAALSCQHGIKDITMHWQQAATLPAIHNNTSLGYAGPVTGFINDTLIVAGGANFPDAMPWMGGKKKYYDDVALYAIKEDTLQLLAQLHLPDTVAYAAVCSAPQGIVYAGGENEHGFTDNVYLVKTAPNHGLQFEKLPSLPLATSNASLTYYNQQLYFAGGETANEVSNNVYALNLQNKASGWQPMPALPQPATHGLLIAQADKLFFIGGRKKTASGISQLFNTLFAFDFATQQWSALKAMPYALSAGTGAAFGSNQIILFGGDKGETFHKTETLIAAIAAQTDPQKKEQLNQQKIAVQASHPGFSKEILLYNILTNQWGIAGQIPFEVPVTSTAFFTGKNYYIPSGEIKAGVRSNTILQLHIKKK